MNEVHQSELLRSLRNKYRDTIIGFCSGGFDVTHPGHVLFFEDCKKHCDILVVGVGSDSVRKIYKADFMRPILNEHLRLKMVSSLKPVDYAFIIHPVPDAAPNPLDELAPVFEALMPNRYIINSDANDIPYRKQLVTKYDTVLMVLERWCPPEYDNISTTSIIAKIQQ